MSNRNKELEAGIYPVVVNDATYGDDRGVIKVQVNVTFTDGPNKGRFGTYEDDVNNKSGPYITRSLKAIGWSGKPDANGNLLGNLASDVQAWREKTGGKTTAEVKHIEIKRGKRYEEWVAAGAPEDDRPIWGKINALGRGPKPLAAPTASSLADANEALANALALDGGSDSAGGGSVSDDEIPFASSAFNHDVNPIAKVLR